MTQEEEILKKKEEFLKIKTPEEMRQRREEFRKIFSKLEEYEEVRNHLDNIFGNCALQKFLGPAEEVYKSKDDKWGSKCKIK